MRSDSQQPGHLTLIELVANVALYGGVGYLAAGWPGAGCGAAFLAGLYAWQIWLAIRIPPPDGSSMKK